MPYGINDADADFFSTDDEVPLANLAKHCSTDDEVSLINFVNNSCSTDDDVPLIVLAHNTPKGQLNRDDERPLFPQTSTPNGSSPPKLQASKSAGQEASKREAQKQNSIEKSVKKLKLGEPDDDDNDDHDHDDDDYHSVIGSDIEVDPCSSSDSDNDERDDENGPGLQWVTKMMPMKPEGFTGPVPGSSITPYASALPLDYFLQIFPGDIWNDMASASNAYVPVYQGRKRQEKGTPDDWTDIYYRTITAEDIKAYIGIRMIMAIDPKPCIEDYWSTDPALGNQFISLTMSRKTFFTIQKYFHVCNPEKDPARIKNAKERREKMQADPLYKVSKLLDHVKTKSKSSYNLNQQVSVDEAMVKCHGSHWGIVGAPNKPAKRGFKVFTLADGTTGYVSDFDVYLRKQRETGLTQRVVEDLCEDIQGRNHIVFVDKYYTSIPLAQSLLKKKTYICGSFNTSRKQWPADLKPDKKKTKKSDPVQSLKRGQSMARQTKSGDMVACV